MAKKKDNKEPPVNLLDMMYQKGYRHGYADGVKKGKQLVFGWLQDIKNGKSIDDIVKESNKNGKG